MALSDLLTAKTPTTLVGQIVSAAQAAGLTTTDWEPGGVELTLIEAFALTLSDVSTSAIPAVVGGGFVDTSTGSWLDLLASQRYALTRTPAVSTVGSLTLTNAAGVGPYTVAANSLIAVSSSGLRYLGPSAGVVVPLSGSITGTFTAESPGAAYNVGAGTITTLATPLPGMSVNNPVAAFSSVSLVGTSTGTVVPTGTVAAHTWTLLIVASGQCAVASYKLSTDGGATYCAARTVPAGADVNVPDGSGATGITLTFANGGASPSFVAGDVFTFTSPATWYTTTGSDEETDAALVARCKARWPSLSGVTTLARYQTWALASSASIKSAIAVTDASINDQVDVYIAGSGAIVTAAEVTAAQNYINARLPLTDRCVVAAASAQTVTPGGATVTVQLSLATLPAAQAEAEARFEAYVRSIAIGGTIRWAEVLSAIMDTAGVIDCTGLTVNGGTANVSLSSAQVATLPASTLATLLTWTTV